MKRYLLIDNLDDTETIKTEEELRKLYDCLLDEIISMNNFPQDEEYRKNVYKEKEEVFKIDIKKVISAIMDIDGFYEIKEYEE